MARWIACVVSGFGEIRMNKTLPAVFIIAIVAILGVEGKLTKFFQAITTPKHTGSVGSSVVDTNPDNGVVSPNPNSSGSWGDPTTPVVGTGSAAASVGNALANLINKHKFAIANPGTDPAFDNYVYGFRATDNQQTLYFRQQFIDCYAGGGDAVTCAQQFLG